MRNEITSDATSEVTSDVTWMSYADLGRARGISAASAKRLAIRRHWRRHQGNDGTARVAVPVTEASPREGKPGDDTGDVTGDPGLLAGALAVLEDAVAGLRGQLEVANARAERAETAIAGERTALTAEACPGRRAARTAGRPGRRPVAGQGSAGSHPG
jgi:hypothetical protein